MRKVLLIGWDAADWKTINRLVDAGDMPVMKGLMEQGSIGNLTTLHPVLSPMLWTSIATGKRPFKHGIHGFAEPNPGGGARPISNLGRTTKAIWNMLNQQGLRSQVVGWWPSHPVEPITGVMVSDMYQKAPKQPGQPWPMRPETVWPERLAEPLAEFRVRPDELSADVIAPFIPKLQEIDLDKDKRAMGVAKILAETSSVQGAASWLLEHPDEAGPWDFMAVYFDGIDHFGHGFMKYHPPQQDWISDRDFELYSGVVDMGYRFHDLMLGSLLSKVDLRETTVVMCSDHGFHPDHLRPRALPKEPAGPAVEHREHGIFLAAGPGIRKDHLIHGATLLDVTPTLLSLFGLPQGEDMDGEPLLSIFEQPPAIETIPSWDAVDGDSAMHPPGKDIAESNDAEAMQQLVDLGYVDKPDANNAEAERQTRRELDYNLAESYMDAGRFGDAIDILERLWGESPMEHRFGVRLAYCAQMLGQTPFQREVVEALLKRRKQESEAARTKLKAFHKVLKARKAERGETDTDTDDGTDAGDEDGVEQAAIHEAEAERLRRSLDVDENQDAEQPPLMSVKEREQYLNLRSQAQFNPYFMNYLLGNVLFDEGRYDEALEVLEKARKASPRSTRLLTLIGRVYLAMKQPDTARQAFDKVVGFDPLHPDAHLGLTRVALMQGRPRDAASLALKTVGLRYQFPWAHHYLGIALEGLQRYRQAAQAFEVAVAQNPNLLEAHRRLENLYANRLKDQARSAEHSAAIEAIGERMRAHRARRMARIAGVDGAAEVKDIELDDPNAETDEDAVLAQEPCDITIVSGLPRSGTSMMMQMLVAGGLPALTDGERAADDDNPRGYYEYEPAKRLMSDRTWLPEADGKVVKIVAQLLPYLPPRPHRYNIVFMQRDLGQVYASQQVMLDNLDRPGSKLPEDKLKQAYAKQIETLKQMLGAHGSITTLWVDHAEVLADPRRMARRIELFLGRDMDLEAMAAVVDPSLHRQRGARTGPQ